MANTHLDNLDINIFLDPAPGPVRGFSNLLILVDEAGGTGNDLGGDRFVTYSSAAEAVTDNATTGFLDAATLTAVQTAFAQDPPPNKVLVGRVDTGGAETYPDGLDAVITAGAQFYGVVTDLRDAADEATQEAFAEHVESGVDGTYLTCLAVNNASWLTATPPTAAAGTMEDIVDNQRTIVVWHDDVTEWQDVAYMANRLAADPDEVSAPWDAEVQAVGAHTAILTQAQQDFLHNETNGGNYANVGLEYGPAAYFVDPGVNMENRPIYEIVTRDWFEARLQERIAALKVAESKRYRKITVDSVGQGKILSVIEALLTQAQSGDSPHLIAAKATAESITQADLDAQRLRFKVQGQIAVSARLFTFNVYFSRQPLVL
jgi:hypothetical protein